MPRSVGPILFLFIGLIQAACERRPEEAVTMERYAEETADPAELAPPAAPEELRQIQATLGEWVVATSPDTLTAGPVTFTIVNQGERVHALAVAGQGRVWETSGVRPRSGASLTADLEPGLYEIYCPIVDVHGVHRELGMQTTMVISP